MTRLYEVCGLRANGFRHGQKVGLMPLEEAEERCQQLWLPRASAKLVSPDSGQVEEPLRPTLIAERCRQRGERKNQGITVV